MVKWSFEISSEGQRGPSRWTTAKKYMTFSWLMAWDEIEHLPSLLHTTRTRKLVVSSSRFVCFIAFALSSISDVWVGIATALSVQYYLASFLFCDTSDGDICENLILGSKSVEHLIHELYLRQVPWYVDCGMVSGWQAEPVCRADTIASVILAQPPDAHHITSKKVFALSVAGEPDIRIANKWPNAFQAKIFAWILTIKRFDNSA